MSTIQNSRQTSFAPPYLIGLLDAKTISGGEGGLPLGRCLMVVQYGLWIFGQVFNPVTSGGALAPSNMHSLIKSNGGSTIAENPPFVSSCCVIAGERARSASLLSGGCFNTRGRFSFSPFMNFPFLFSRAFSGGSEKFLVLMRLLRA